MNKRINIVLSEKTLNALHQVPTTCARSRFIDRAILRYVETEGKRRLHDQLKAGYLANAERDLEAALAWFPLEDEAARASNVSSRKRSVNAHDLPETGRYLSCPVRSRARQ
jgi:hypothetical protein